MVLEILTCAIRQEKENALIYKLNGWHGFPVLLFVDFSPADLSTT